MRIAILIAGFVAALGALPASAHEFWISPETYRIGPEDQLRADIRVGQAFEGAAYAYIPQQFVRFDLVLGDAVVAVEGRIGDMPALQMAPPGEGLVVVVHQTVDHLLTYQDSQLFRDFVIHKDFAWALDDHAARGLPETGFRERYSRYGKSLIAVGQGRGADGEVGMLTEFVAEANPYTDDLSGGMPVQVLYQGAPRAGAQVEVFAKDASGAVTVTLHRTDAEGRVAVPVQPGVEYLFDAVVMRPLEPEADGGPVWESLWASLTFRVPDR